MKTSNYWKMKLNKKKLRYFIKDETKAIKEYKKHGLYSLAKDEASHRTFLRQLIK
jgi:hypothetical protein